MQVKCIRWLFFGCLFSAIPYLLSLWFYNFVGYEMDSFDYVPDYLLIVFAIAGNAISNVTDRSKRIPITVRWILAIASTISAGFCLINYFALFNYDFISLLIVELLKNDPVKLKSIHVLARRILWGNVIIGLAAELIPEFQKRRKKKKAAVNEPPTTKTAENPNSYSQK